jgi:hypothetical protein
MLRVNAGSEPDPDPGTFPGPNQLPKFRPKWLNDIKDLDKGAILAALDWSISLYWDCCDAEQVRKYSDLSIEANGNRSLIKSEVC